MHTKSTQVLAAAAAATCGQGGDCPKQRPLGDNILNAFQKNILVHKLHTWSKRQVLSCSKTAEAPSVFENDNKEIQGDHVCSSKKNEECLDKDSEILRLIEERRSMPKEKKQRLKDLSKNFKKCIREKKNEKTARH